MKKIALAYQQAKAISNRLEAIDRVHHHGSRFMDAYVYSDIISKE